LRLDREKYPMTFPMALRLNGVIAQEVAVRKSRGAWLPAVCAQREARNGASMVQKARSRGCYGVAAGAPPAGASEERRPRPALKRPVFATLHIPRLEHRPTLEDFLDMQPAPAFADKMLKVEGFIQRDPKDGAPASQKTEVYLGYTDKNLYVVCICFESEPSKIRARMGRREAINDDDQFGFVLDTFHDRKHGVFFYLNPLGVQQDGI